MTCTVLFGGRPGSRARWRTELTKAFELHRVPVKLHMDPAETELEQVNYVLCQSGGAISDFGVFPRVRAFLSLWAGVEWVVANSTFPPDVPVIRMVEDGMTQGMVDYVVGHVLRYHLDLDDMVAGRLAGEWGQTNRPLAFERGIGILGLGVLGAACGTALRQIGFTVRGWSRRPKTIPGIECYTGSDGMRTLLAATEILVLLLPFTPDTENLIDAEALAALPPGARIINPARGHVIDDEALLAALGDGRLAHATLDTFRIEPLPLDHPFRENPRITVTPHIASITHARTAAQSIARQIALDQSGRPFEHVLDRSAGY